jgi:signal peptidase
MEKGGRNMPRDKKILYAISISLLSLLSLILLVIPASSSRYTAAILLLACVGVCHIFIKKRSILSYNKKQVLGLMTVIALVYVMLLYISGLHFGFNNSFSSFGTSIYSLILPSTVIIITTEMIRRVMLAQNNRVASVLCFISCVFAEVLMLYSLNDVHTFNRFMDIVGLTFLPAIMSTALYHYTSQRFGALPNIVYRLIITLYAYILPVVPALTEVLLSLIKLILPMIVYAFISGLYEKKRRFAVAKKKNKLSYIAVGITTVVIVSVAMLISCQFKYGALVIATGSMTGEINVGDMAIYESYDDQEIEIGQVIVFKKRSSKVVHRVVKKENVDGIVRYYTKGDIYEELDEGYVLKEDIIGLARVRVPYVGYPTIWLRGLFD